MFTEKLDLMKFQEQGTLNISRVVDPCLQGWIDRLHHWAPYPITARSKRHVVDLTAPRILLTSAEGSNRLKLSKTCHSTATC